MKQFALEKKRRYQFLYYN